MVFVIISTLLWRYYGGTNGTGSNGGPCPKAINDVLSIIVDTLISSLKGESRNHKCGSRHRQTDIDTNASTAPKVPEIPFSILFASLDDQRPSQPVFTRAPK